jgi:hypothetical protein
MLAIRRKLALRSGSGTSAARPLHSAAKRRHSSAYFLTLNSDMPLFPKGGSACISQSSAGQSTVPVMTFKWGREGYIASAIFGPSSTITASPISESRSDFPTVPQTLLVAADGMIERPFRSASIDGGESQFRVDAVENSRFFRRNIACCRPGRAIRSLQLCSRHLQRDLGTDCPALPAHARSAGAEYTPAVKEGWLDARPASPVVRIGNMGLSGMGLWC